VLRQLAVHVPYGVIQQYGEIYLRLVGGIIYPGLVYQNQNLFTR
jgi:hypothetical protein